MNLQVTTFEKNSIKLEWQEPDTKDKIIVFINYRVIGEELKQKDGLLAIDINPR